MKKPLKITLISVFIIAAMLLIIELILSQTYVMPPKSKRTKIFTYGNIDDVKEFLDQPESYLTINDHYILIDFNRIDIMEIIFRDYKYSPDFNFKYDQATPLLHAAKEFKPEAVRILVKYGADVNYKDPYGVTPLIAASYTTFERENSASLEITKILVEAGADVNVVAKYGKRAIAGVLYLNEDLERLKYLIDNGGDINQVDSDGLNYMFHCDSFECYEYFLSKGLDINSVQYDGTNILQSSLYLKKNMELTIQQLEWGADICHKDNAGDTVLNHVERQNTGPHDKKENPEYYQKRLTENRASEMYKYLEKEYNKRCLENPKNSKTESLDKITSYTYDQSFNI